MGLLDRFRLNKKEQGNSQPIDPNNSFLEAINKLLHWRHGAQSIEFDKAVHYIENGYKTNPHVYAVINYINRSVSKLPFQVYEVVDEKAHKRSLFYKSKADFDQAAYYQEKALQPTSNQEIATLVSRPNENQTWEMFLEDALGFFLLTGNRYMFGLRPEGMNLITKTYYMPSQLVTVRTTGDFLNPISSYQLGIRGDQTRGLEPENVCHGKMWNPQFDDHEGNTYGLSPLAALKYVVMRTNEAKESSLANFKNGMPPGILSNESGLSMDDKDMKGLESQWAKKFSGGKNSGKPLITSQKFNWQNLGFSHVEMDLLAAEVADLQDVCRVYGVPSVLVDDNTNSTYNNVTEAEKRFWANTAIPHIDRFVGEWNNFITPAYNERYNKTFVLDYDVKVVPALQQDKETLSDRLIKEMNNGMWTPNQVRQMLDKEVGEEPHLNEYVRLNNVSTIKPDSNENQEQQANS